MIEAPPVYLTGPFGTHDGLATGALWPDAEALRVLDTFVRSAPLSVGFRDSDIAFDRWTVLAAPADSPSDETADVLDEGPATDERTDLAVIEGPSPGDWIVRADVTPGLGDPASYHWSLHVPDRPVPAGGRIEPPLPDLVVSVDGDTATAAVGSSCYIYTCAEVPRPAVDALPALESTAGDELILALSDESAFVSWVVSAWPVTDRDDRRSREVARGEAPAGTTSATVETPGSGDWYVSLSVVFDLERGSATYSMRLTEP